MSLLNFQVYLNASSDQNCGSTNNPSMSNFRWQRSEKGLLVSNPSSNTFELAPGESQTLFNGIRTLTQDGTTLYSLALAPNQTSIYQLTWSGGTNPTFRTARLSGADATTGILVTLNGPVMTLSSAPSIAASFSGQVAGMTTNITITANTLGPSGNSVSLSFDGSTSVSTAISNWNTANPSNAIALTTGDGTQIPTNGATIALTGGASHTPLNLIANGVQVGDFVNIGTSFNVLNQGQWQIISLTSTSLSVVNQGGVDEGPIYLGSGYASQLDIYSAAGVQIGDTLVINGGFSPVSWGSYQITNVTDQYIQFSSTAILPAESNIMTEDIAVYFAAKSLLYMEVSQECTVAINGEPSIVITPLSGQVCCNGVGRPGILLITTPIHSLVITNNGEAQATVFLASVE